MTLEVKKYGNQALRAKASPVAAVDGGIRSLAGEMLRTMYASNGVGLAAEQVGRREALCVIHVPSDQQRNGAEELDSPPPVAAMPMVLVNPVIVASEGVQVGQEGCLSFPEIYVNLRRAQRVTVAFTDLDGERRVVEACGLLARAIQHELDHLAGVLLVDRMSAVQKVGVAGRLKRLKREGMEQIAEPAED